MRISSAYTRLYYISNIVKDLASILYISKYTNKKNRKGYYLYINRQTDKQTQNVFNNYVLEINKRVF
jgi:hypothetical protein